VFPVGNKPQVSPLRFALSKNIVAALDIVALKGHGFSRAVNAYVPPGFTGCGKTLRESRRDG
jgi:hypothetical protein